MRRLPAGARPWVGRGLLALAVWAALCLGLRAIGADPDPGLVALAVLAAGALLLLVEGGLAVQGTGEQGWHSVGEAPLHAPGKDARLLHLARLVEDQQAARTVGGHLHATLLGLADRRLVARHGVALAADRERALGLLGPDLAALARTLDGPPPYPRLTPTHIDRLLTRIEEL